jgi:hypothetical protein
MAVTAHTPQLKMTFLELSKNWEKLAIQLEDAFGKLVENDTVGSNLSLNATKRLSGFSLWKLPYSET